jgi:hypothetical protein
MEYFTLGLTAEILSERLSIVLIGLLLHGLCFGGLLLLQQFFAPITFPAWLRAPLPYHWICPLFFRAEDKLNRADRAPTKRAWRGGAVLTATLIASWLMASIATLFFLYSLPSPYCVALLIAALLPLGYAATPLYLPNEAPSNYTVARGSYAEMVLIDDAHVRRLQLERLARALLETALLTAGFLIAELHGLIALSLLCALYHSVSVPTTRYYAYGILIRMLYEALCFIPRTRRGGALLPRWIFRAKYRASFWHKRTIPARSREGKRRDQNRAVSCFLPACFRSHCAR